jgi:hypothetical protein
MASEVIGVPNITNFFQLILSSLIINLFSVVGIPHLISTKMGVNNLESQTKMQI